MYVWHFVVLYDCLCVGEAAQLRCRCPYTQLCPLPHLLPPAGIDDAAGIGDLCHLTHTHTWTVAVEGAEGGGSGTLC